MSPPSGTRDEYSRKDGGSGRVLGRRRGAPAPSPEGAGAPPGGGGARTAISRRLRYPRGLAPAVLLVAAVGATLLLAAEFVNLYGVHIVGRAAPIDVVSGGANNSYAMVPIALLAVVLGLGALGNGGRWDLGALAGVGLVALWIGLLGDLPAAQQSDHLIRFGGRYVLGSSSPSLGMYLETLGAVLLVVAAGFGLLFGEPPERYAPPTR